MVMCASLSKQGRPLDQKTTGIHPYVLKKTLIPNVKKWGFIMFEIGTFDL